MINKALPISISLLAAGLLASCQKHETPESVSTGAAPQAAPQVANGPTPAPRMTLDMSYLIPEEFVFAADAAPGGFCALDVMNGARLAEASIPAESDVVFGGWAGDAEKQVPVDALFVLKGEQSSYAVPLIQGGQRPDVARSLENESMSSSGFNLPVRLTGVAPGTYSLFIINDRASSAFCALKASLVVD